MGSRIIDDYLDEKFIEALKVPPGRRSTKELEVVFCWLREMEALCWVREAPLRQLCFTVRYEVHNANDILYCRGELAICWYILLRGSVFIDGSMFLPRSSFGKPSGGGRRRTNECLILESSSVIAIDYPDVQIMRPGIQPRSTAPSSNNISNNPLNVDRLLALDPDNPSNQQQHCQQRPLPSDPSAGTAPLYHHHNNQHNINVHGTKSSNSSGSQHQGHHHHHHHHHHQQQRPLSNGAVVRSSSNPPPQTHSTTPIITDTMTSSSISSSSSHHQQHNYNHQQPNNLQQHIHHNNHHQQQHTNLSAHHHHSSHQQYQQVPSAGGATTVGVGGQSMTGSCSSPHNNPQTEAYLPDLVRGVRSRGSVASGGCGGNSDTSSAYSGSDIMCHSSVHSLDHDDVDLSGLMESVVDSDEEDLAESMQTLAVRDAVRECLEKDPSERTEDDIKVLLEFTQRLKAFADKPLVVRKAMCQAMVFAVVDDAGTVLMNDGEELDSWSVIINGHVQVTSSTGSYQLHLGDSFGIPPTMEKMYHSGVMRSMVEDCQFVCIKQSDYYRILHQGEQNTQRIVENGKLVLVMEQRCIQNKKGNIVIKGTPERLMAQLGEVEYNVDPTYVEDFLLTHRTFLSSPLIVAEKLLSWFESPALRDLATRVVLLWVNNHFTDFEMDPVMMDFLEKFEEGLEKAKMEGQLRLLDFACAAKARSRTVTLTRPSRDENLHFGILGGYRKKYGIFISKVEKGSKAEEVGLKRGDQILEVNGQSFEQIEHSRALEVLRCTCHLAITVKSNLLAFKEMLQTPENSPRPHSRSTTDGGGGAMHGSNGSARGVSAAADFASTLNFVNTLASPRTRRDGTNNRGAFMTLNAHWFKDAIRNLLPRNSHVEVSANSDDSVSSQSSSVGGPGFHSHSNPDLTAIPYEEPRQEFPEHVLKVFRASDQSSKFLPVHQETTAREVVMLALQIFNINDPSGSSNYALYEVTVTEEGIRKQKRLPDGLQNLAERIGLSSRYYLRNIASSQNLVPDEIVNELIKESQVQFLQLNSVEVAIQLTLEDFAIFRQIEPTEYIDYLFELKSKYGTPALSQFAELVNREMFWVVTEVCTEHNVVKRSKIIKRFIKIARICKECKNFNSMFAILSGLGHRSVSRLRSSWEKLHVKHHRLFIELQDLMDPSRNMSKYRNLIHDDAIEPPCIPFYPVVAKDLRFAHDGNEESTKELINFETLRMISRYIRDMQNMCSTPYYPQDLVNMVESRGQPVSNAMCSMNQMSAGQQHNTVKRRNKSATTHDKKKMFEEAQMVRRVKAYLAKLTVITDEDDLEKKSYQCEPGISHSNLATNNTGASSAASSGHGSAGSSSSSTSGVSNNNNNTTTAGGAPVSAGGGSNSSSAPSSSNPQRRRPHSPTPSTTSSTSSTSHTSDGRKPSKFGAASPQSMRKMMALAEAKTKPYHGPRASSTSSVTLSSSHHSSPGPSPRAPRRGPTGALAGGLATITTSHLTAASNLAARSNCAGHNNHHERSHSDTPAIPVDLSAESSSVTSLSNIRKSLTQGSMSGSDNAAAVLQQCDADSGISSHYDCHSSTSLDGGDPVVLASSSVGGYTALNPPSPPAHHRRYSQQPDGRRGQQPPFLNAVPVLPPLPQPPPGCPPRRRVASTVVPPPDYHSTQLRHLQQMGRAMSHDAAVQYYHANPVASVPVPQHSRKTSQHDDEDEAQVSAV
uniref:Rap guanine nucleotide exchange factor 2-like n=2 Tax=Hirondellea gigas TaxID=1518452 RepID=A0A6A7FVZ9_9CRUS